MKGDLLEGANAYHCEKCNKKVSLCFNVIYSNRLEHGKSSITSIICDSITLIFACIIMIIVIIIIVDTQPVQSAAPKLLCS